MPLIEPENKKKPQKICVCLTWEAYEELGQYCRFIDSSSNHVIGALVHQVLSKDRDFQAWKATAAGMASAPQAIPTETRGRKKMGNEQASSKAVSVA